MSEISLHKGNKTALLVGNTGLTGKYCEEYLWDHSAYTKLVTFARKPVKVRGKEHIHHVIDFTELSKYRKLFFGDDLFLCLGTTMDKAGSKEAFYQVDYTMNYEIAEISSANKVRQLMLVSAVGADPDSMFFYNRVKGELEEAVKELNFWATHIFQPSLIMGDRNEKRPLESVAQSIMGGAGKIFGSLLHKYQPVEARKLAKALVVKAQSLQSGVFTHASHNIVKIADQYE